MPRFSYSARDPSGQTTTAELSAPSRKEAVRHLAARGLQPLRLEELAASGSKETKRPAGFSLLERSADYSRADFLPFLQSLSELVGSGLSAGEAIRMLSARLKEPGLRALCAAIWERLSEGQTLSGALEGLPAVFDRQTVSLIRAGEATGSLNDVLLRLITHHLEQKELRTKLITALLYPVFVCFVAFGVILFFVLFLMPRLRTLLDSLGGNLPFSTQLLVSSAEFLLRYSVVLIPLGLFLILLAWRWRQTEPGRVVLDRWAVQTPGVRRLAIDAAVLNFTQTLAVLLENGITPADALRLTERTIGNRSVQAAIRVATDRVLEGENLSSALARTGYFADLTLDRIAVGESTGQLAPCLRDLSRNYAAAQSRRLHGLTTVISSAVLLFAFAFVGFIAYAIVSAVLQVSGSFKF
ncbi:MAG TPA: type II secretion system F family protein [Opitutaceae bacterium]|nr:type II secretion system F family protein [Opitutaceae bacterium]